MRLLLDMNLSPLWCAILQSAGHDTVHWSEIGSLNAPDLELMAWAQNDVRVVVTHDLDFGAILAATQAAGPSVIQLRTQGVLPAQGDTLLVDALEQYGQMLDDGALVVVEPSRARARVLPLRRRIR